MRAPLWMSVQGNGAHVSVALAKCRNCGQTKITSRPCGFDHLAAILQYRANTEGADHAD